MGRIIFSKYSKVKSKKTIEIDPNGVSKYLHYLGIKKSDFLKDYKNTEVLVEFTSKEIKELNDLLHRIGDEKYYDFIVWFIAHIRYSLQDFKNRIEVQEDYNKAITINKRSNGIYELIRMLEYYVEYEKKSGYGIKSAYDNPLVNASLSFKPLHGKGITIKNGEIVHDVLAAVFRSFTGIKDACKIKDDSWKDTVTAKYCRTDLDKERMDYLTSVVKFFKEFFISEGLCKSPINAKLPLRIADWVVTIFQLADFEIKGKTLDQKNVTNWYKRSVT